MKDENNFILATKKFEKVENITVGDLRTWMTNVEKYKENISDLINHRFSNRYLKHLQDTESGFLIMAVCCYVIESLESFYQGWEDTKGKSQETFKSFFNSREKNLFPNLAEDMKNDKDNFYSNIRCGILHQSETMNAWRITVSGDLYDTKKRTINRNEFLDATQQAVTNYVESLMTTSAEDKLWENAIIKLKYICDHCKHPQ